MISNRWDIATGKRWVVIIEPSHTIRSFGVPFMPRSHLRARNSHVDHVTATRQSRLTQ